MKKVLMITSEAVPFAKAGGLADVLGSLPKVLVKKGCDTRVIMPKYGSIPTEHSDKFELITQFDVKMGWRNQYCGIFRYVYEGVTFYFIDNEFYFGGDAIYHYYDRDIERFSFFTRAVMEAIPRIDFQPDILHCHDWQSAMIPLLLNYQYKKIPFYSAMKTILTIHNLQYQGIYSKDVIADFLELPSEYFDQSKAGFFDQANFLKAGIVYADIVTTVSKTYANDIKFAFYGENLDQLLRESSGKLKGILNGLDYDIYNPATDPYITPNFDITTVGKGKAAIKKSLQKELSLTLSPNTPIVSMVTRLTKQKGLDLVDYIFDEIMEEDLQLVVLGTGDPQYEEMFKSFSERYPGRVASKITFSNSLAQKIYAGSDMFLMPSLYEPCGIGQMIALRYGTIPVVRETGGLKDTIESYDPTDNTGNGFTFYSYNAHDMLCAIRRGLGFYNDTKAWSKLIVNAMESNFSWDVSSDKYIELYESI